MDFTKTSEQDEVASLASLIFEGRASPGRVKEVESTAERFDRALWAELANANLLGIAVPTERGGSGLGIVETCLILEQQGRRVAPVPLLHTATAIAALVDHGNPDQQGRWLPAVASGEAVLTTALTEDGSNDALRPRTIAAPDRGGWRLDGTKICVPFAHVAARVMVPASAAGGVIVFMVDPTADGVTATPVDTTDHEPQFHLRLDGVHVGDGEVLSEPGLGDALVEKMVSTAMVGLSALQVGVSEEALRMAASYTSERHQFGRPLATNQSVALKAADAYIDVEAMRVTMLQAAWRMTTGRDASREVLVAKWWASEGGHRVLHTVQHLHGGLGADVDYPVHRYFLWGKQIEVTLGGAAQQLERLGLSVAEVVRR